MFLIIRQSHLSFRPLSLVLFLLASFALAACQAFSQPNLPTNHLPIADVVVHESWSDTVRFTTEFGSARGLAAGFVAPSQRDTPLNQRSQTVQVSLPAREVWETLLMLSSKTSTTTLVTVLLDYQQIEFELDGHKGLLHEVELPAEGILEIPLKVEGLQPGWHDLIVMAFADPYDTSLDPHERMEAFGKMVGRRTVLLVGDSEEKPTLPPTIQGVPIPPEVTIGLGVSFAEGTTSRQHPSERQLYVTQGTAGEPLEFQVWASSDEEDSQAIYAALLFHDYHLVPINGQQPILFDLDPDEEFVLDMAVTLPTQTGISELQLVHVFDPYRSILHEEVRAPFVFHSARVGVAVLPPPAQEASTP